MKQNYLKKDYYNLLEDDHVNNKDFESAKKIQNEFEMNTGMIGMIIGEFGMIGNCHGLYLKTGVLL